MREYRPDIDGLRAIAVLVVVLFHAGFGMPGGFVGVDVFFVISGFLITGLLARDLDAGTFSLAGFWERRVRRILPAATVVVLATLAIGLLVLIPHSADRLGRAAVAQATMLANFYYWWTVSYFGGPAELLPLLHGWSLAVEEQFYVVFPLVFVLAWRRGRRFTVIFLGIVAIASFLESIREVRSYPDSAFYLLPSRAWELLLGGIVALLPTPDRMGRPTRTVLTGLGLAAIIGSCLWIDPTMPFPGVLAALPCLGTALAIWSEAPGLTTFGRLLALPPMRFVGLTSYSFYLWHWPVLSLLRNLIGEELPPSVSATAILLAFGLAVLTWRFVETPFRRKSRDLSSRTVLIRGALASVMVVAIGGMVWLLQGIPARLDEEESRFVRNLRGSHRLLMPMPFDFRSLPPTIGACGPSDSEPTLLLWGDSHAVAASEAIDEAAKRAGICGVACLRANSSPVPGLWREGDRPERDEFNQRVLEWIERTPSLRRVVLIARWSSFVNAKHSGAPARLVTDDPFAAATPESAIRVLGERLAELADRLRRRGVSLCIVKEVPYQDLGPQQVFARRAFTGSWDFQGVHRESHLKREAPLDRAFAALEPYGVEIVDLATGLFDDLGYSSLGDADGSHYYDRNHLSPHGALRAIGPIAAEIIGSAGSGNGPSPHP